MTPAEAETIKLPCRRSRRHEAVARYLGAMGVEVKFATPAAIDSGIPASLRERDRVIYGQPRPHVVSGTATDHLINDIQYRPDAGRLTRDDLVTAAFLKKHIGDIRQQEGIPKSEPVVLLTPDYLTRMQITD